MFEQSFVNLKNQVEEKYGKKGVEVLKEFRNKEILDVIANMSDVDLELFYHIIKKNLFETEILLNSCIRKGFLPEERRFDYDSFYHNCYQKFASLIEKKDFKEIKCVALQYENIMENIRTNIKSADDIKKCFTTIYEVKDEMKLSFAKKIYHFKKYIEKYLKKLVLECGFGIEVTITVNDVLMLANSILNGLDEEDFLSKLSFLKKQKKALNRLRAYEEEFKEILVKLAFDENNNFIILTNNYTKTELEIYLFIAEGLSKTKPIKEQNLLDNIFTSGEVVSLKKESNNYGEENV